MSKAESCVFCKYSEQKYDKNSFWFACKKTGEEPIKFSDRKENKCPLARIQYKFAKDNNKKIFWNTVPKEYV